MAHRRRSSPAAPLGGSPVPSSSRAAGDRGAVKDGTKQQELRSSGRPIQPGDGEMEVVQAEPWARQLPTLPQDVVLDIVARCDDDAKTVVRCGLVSKTLRRGMLNHAGLHARLSRRGGFDPGVLVAVSYRLTRNDPIVVQPSGRLPRFHTGLLRSFDPATSSTRDCLLVLRDKERLATDRPSFRGLLVCDTITGRVTSLPSTSIGLRTTDGVYQPALLSVGDAAVRSFELFVMCTELLSRRLLTQNFSSVECMWGAPREIHIQNGLPPGVQSLYDASSTAPAVVGRSVHWLCYTDPVSLQHLLDEDDTELIILAVRTDESARANLIRLPGELLTSMGNPSSWRSSWTSYAGRFMLAATAAAEGERRLSLFAAEPFVISMWTLVLHPDEGSNILWSRQEVIRKQEIDRPLSSSVFIDPRKHIRFSMFGERSGTVLFWMQTAGARDADQAILVQLNLVSKKTQVLWRGSDYFCDETGDALLHEINPISVLKSF